MDRGREGKRQWREQEIHHLTNSYVNINYCHHKLIVSMQPPSRPNSILSACVHTNAERGPHSRNLEPMFHVHVGRYFTNHQLIPAGRRSLATRGWLLREREDEFSYSYWWWSGAGGSGDGHQVISLHRYTVCCHLQL